MPIYCSLTTHSPSLHRRGPPRNWSQRDPPETEVQSPGTAVQVCHEIPSSVEEALAAQEVIDEVLCCPRVELYPEIAGLRRVIWHLGPKIVARSCLDYLEHLLCHGSLRIQSGGRHVSQENVGGVIESKSVYLPVLIVSFSLIVFSM